MLCNRGANGIDGTVSAAFGAAADGSGPVVLLIGDVALAHDIGGLLAARRLALKLTIVLLDNGGGGIFDFLPVSRAPMAREPEARSPGSETRDTAASQDIYTRHIATPTGLDFAQGRRAVRALARARRRTSLRLRGALERALAREGSSIVEALSDRARNVELHGRVWDAVSGALSPPAAGAAPPA